MRVFRRAKRFGRVVRFAFDGMGIKLVIAARRSGWNRFLCGLIGLIARRQWHWRGECRRCDWLHANFAGLFSGKRIAWRNAVIVGPCRAGSWFVAGRGIRE